MPLTLEPHLKLGIATIHREGDEATGPWLPRIDDLCRFVELADRSGFDSLWVGDHISFALQYLDPLLMLSQAAVVSRRLTLGTGVYLLPLRPPAPVAKQIATLDHLTEGRFIFGVGVGGEFPKEYEVCGVPLGQRGARLTESLEVIRKLWTGETVSHRGRFFGFQDVVMRPPPRQAAGPPIWCGGRSDGALRRAAQVADGWLSYVVTPDMYRKALAKIVSSAEEHGRAEKPFGTGHLLFARIGDSYEEAMEVAVASLSRRYAMDFRPAAERYAAIGTPAQVAERIRAFHEAGVRHLIVDFVGPYDRREEQIERYAAEVMPALADLRVPSPAAA